MRNLSKYLVLLSVITVSMLACVHQQISIIQSSYQINKSKVALSKLVEQNKNLNFKLTSLSSPGKLHEKLSQANVDLVYPAKVALLKVEPMPIKPMLFAHHNEVGTEENKVLKILGLENVAIAGE